MELSAADSRIILDIGMPLPEPGERGQKIDPGTTAADLIASGVLPDVPGLYAHQVPEVEAVIVTHAHGDHCGLASFVHPDIPVYASEGTAAILGVNAIFLPWLPALKKVQVLPKSTPVRMGPFTVTGLLVDHSAPDALALLVEAEGKRVFYSGDLRGHGRKGVLFDRLVADPPRDIDCLLLEGTMVGQPERACASESDVEGELVKVFEKKRNLALVFCSSQNIDRIVSVYRAAKRTGCFLVIDLYTAYVLDAMRIISDRLPNLDWQDVRVFFYKHHADLLGNSGHEEFLYRASRARIRVEEIAEKKAKAVVLAKANSLLPIIPGKVGDIADMEAIWSMWSGYLSGDDSASRFFAKHGIKPRMIHAGGHATLDDLKRLVGPLRPARIIPIHTLHPERFPQEFHGVCMADDGEPVVV